MNADQLWQIVLSCVLVSILGSVVKLAVFPQALIAADVDSATRQTSFLVAFGVTKAFGNFFIGAASDRYGRRWTHMSGWYIGLLLPVLLLIFAYLTRFELIQSQSADSAVTDTVFLSNKSAESARLKFVLAPPLQSCASACTALHLDCKSLGLITNQDLQRAFVLSTGLWCADNTATSTTACNFKRRPIVCEHMFTANNGIARIDLDRRNCSTPLSQAGQGVDEQARCDTRGQGPWQRLCRCTEKVQAETNLENKYWWILVLSDTFLGLNQAICWSTNIFILIDLLGPRKKGLAISLSDGIGYLCGSAMPLLAAFMTTSYGPESPFYLVAVLMTLASIIGSIFLRESKLMTPSPDDTGGDGDGNSVQKTGGGVKEQKRTTDTGSDVDAEKEYSFRTMGRTFLATTLKPHTLVLCFGGLCVNFLTALVWGLTTTWSKKVGLSAALNAVVSVVYVALKALAQLTVGFWSDRVANRKSFIVGGFLIASVGVILTSAAGFTFAIGGSDPSLTAIAGLLMAGGGLMGLGTGATYPLLQAGIADHFSSEGGKCMASAIGTYRFWRDLGYAVGGLCTGALDDVSGSFGLTALLSSIVSLSAAIAIGTIYQDPASLTDSNTDTTRHDTSPVAVVILTTSEQ